MAKLSSLQLCYASIKAHKNIFFNIPRLPYFPRVLLFGCVLIHIHPSSCKSHGRAALSLNQHLLSRAGQTGGVWRGSLWAAVMRFISAFPLQHTPFFAPTASLTSFIKKGAQTCRGQKMRSVLCALLAAKCLWCVWKVSDTIESSGQAKPSVAF